MPQIKPGHRLYLYRLFSRELGVGKQTALARAEQALAEDGLAPADLGFDDARSLFEALSECVKLTVFKKGAVFVTVLANEEYDQALARAEKNGGKQATGTKSFKRGRGGKNIKPLKPKHIEEKAAEPEPEPTAEDVVEPEPEPIVETAPEPVAEAVPEPEAEPTSEPEPTIEAAAETDAAAEPFVEATPEANPEPEPESKTNSEAPAEPSAQPAEPSIHLTITYTPDTVEANEPEVEAETAPAPEVAPAPAPAPRTARPANDLPQDFYADVRVTDEPLSTLYQVLPHDVDPVSMLEEDFRIARSTGMLKGTRSEVSFPLRFQLRDGSAATATLRRRARAVGGKKWSLAEVSVDAPEEVGMGHLSHRPAGPWAAFASEDELKGCTSPGAELAQFAVLGSWEKLLEELAGLAAPEDWGEGRGLLREYLAMTFCRVKRQHRISTADDGSGAAFDTGLLTAAGEPIAAVLEPHDGDIAWELTCFSINAQGRPATYPSPFASEAAGAQGGPATERGLRERGTEVAQPLHRALQRAERNPRFATLAYDAIGDRVAMLLPVGNEVAALLADEDGRPRATGTIDPSDAYACARVVSSDQPDWLIRMAKEAEK